MALPTHTLTTGLTTWIPRTPNPDPSLTRLLPALAAVPTAVLAQGSVRAFGGVGARVQDGRPKGKYCAMCATPASIPRTDMMIRFDWRIDSIGV